MEKLTKSKENRILKNLFEVFEKGDIRLLDSHGYNFLYICSGFIAHYNLHGFIEHYGSVYALKRDILDNQPNNQWCNFRKGEKDYEYMMQKKDIYNKICGYANGDKRFKKPKEKDVFKEAKIENFVLISTLDRQKCIDKFSEHLFSGFYFQISDNKRAIDLADAVMAFDALVRVGKNLTEEEFFNLELEFRSGNKGTVKRLFGIYHDSIWNVFYSLLGIYQEEEI